MVHFLLSSFAIRTCSVVWPFIHWPHFTEKFTVCELRLRYDRLEWEYFFGLFDLFLLVCEKLLQRGHTSSYVAFGIILLLLWRFIIVIFCDLFWVFNLRSGEFEGRVWVLLILFINKRRLILIWFEFWLLFPVVFENIFDFGFELDFVVTFPHGLHD